MPPSRRRTHGSLPRRSPSWSTSSASPSTACSGRSSSFPRCGAGAAGTASPEASSFPPACSPRSPGCGCRRSTRSRTATTDVPIRLFFGSAMLVSLVLGVVAIRRRDFVRHGAWMTRGYAIGVAAGTQALVISAWLLLVGTPDELTRALLMAAAWVINLAVAEYVIRRRARRSGRTAPSAGRSGPDRCGSRAMKAACGLECLNSTSECRSGAAGSVTLEQVRSPACQVHRKGLLRCHSNHCPSWTSPA